MNKTVIEFHSCGSSGNIFYIIGMVQTVMRKEKRIQDYNEMWERVNSSKSYENALKIIREYVTLIDLDGIY